MVERAAEFWQALGGGEVECQLCYRQCVIPAGEAGWCQHRRNEGGKLVVIDYGVTSRLSTVLLGFRGMECYYPGALALEVGGLRCNANCGFCFSHESIADPERMPWQENTDGEWEHRRVRLSPKALLLKAVKVHATHLAFTDTEPTLNPEYLLDVGELARSVGIKLLVFSNGFTSPAAIRALAPFVDGVAIGIKAGLSPEFYARRMGAPGAVPAVQAAMYAWKDAGVWTGIINLVPPEHLLAAPEHEEAETQFYQWIAEHLGPLTPVQLGPFCNPADTAKWLVDGEAATSAYEERLALSWGRTYNAGLKYVTLSGLELPIACHACGKVISYLEGYVQFATDGHCEHCGAEVPVLTVPREWLAFNYKLIQAYFALYPAGMTGRLGNRLLQPLIAAAGTEPPPTQIAADRAQPPPRAAELWTPLPGERVRCELCFRRCLLREGSAGFCCYRRNEGGRMVIPEHGVLSTVARTQLGYFGLPTFHPGGLAMAVSAIRCNAACDFCYSEDVVRKPERIPWADGVPGSLGDGHIWQGRRAILQPETLVEQAQHVGADHILLSGNEPTVSFEYTLDAARLAKARGMDVVLLSNGFSTPAAICELAPFVDAVGIGVKAALLPFFYETRIDAKGARPAVKEAILEWKRAGVFVAVVNVVAPWCMAAGDEQKQAERSFYRWLAQEVGPLTPLEIIPMLATPSAPTDTGLVVESSGLRSCEKRLMLSAENAKAAGLAYAHLPKQDITCHNCGALLLRVKSPMLDCAPCTMAYSWCQYWTHEQHVEEGRCEQCGVEVPIRALSPARLAETRRVVAERGKSAVSRRMPITLAR